MNVQSVVAASAARTRTAIDGIARFAKLERVLAGLCALTPALLILADDGNVRGSISAYHSVCRPEAYYMPLTAAAMLFLVNGVVKDGQLYNVFLGLALGGLVFFNTSDFTPIHVAFAAAFFAGNVAVMALWTSVKGWRVRGPLIAVIVVAMVLWFGFKKLTLFGAEWISLGIIATHFIVESVVDGEGEGAA